MLKAPGSSEHRSSMFSRFMATPPSVSVVGSPSQKSQLIHVSTVQERIALNATIPGTNRLPRHSLDDIKSARRELEAINDAESDWSGSERSVFGKSVSRKRRSFDDMTPTSHSRYPSRKASIIMSLRLASRQSSLIIIPSKRGVVGLGKGTSMLRRSSSQGNHVRLQMDVVDDDVVDDDKGDDDKGDDDKGAGGEAGGEDNVDENINGDLESSFFTPSLVDAGTTGEEAAGSGGGLSPDGVNNSRAGGEIMQVGSGGSRVRPIQDGEGDAPVQPTPTLVDGADCELGS